MPSFASESSGLPAPSDLIAAARSMLSGGRPAAARPLVAALERLASDSPELAELESSLAAAEGRVPDAIEVLSRTLGKNAGDVDARMRRAGLLFRSGNVAAALADAAEAVLAAPETARPKTLLGLLLLERGDVERATACLRDALANDPSDPEIRVALAEAALRAGDRELARGTVADGLDRTPYHLALRRVAVRVAIALGNLERAKNLAEEARHSGLVDPILLRLQADAENALGEQAAADEHWKLAFELDPTDPALRARAVASGLVPPARRLSTEAVARWFDGLADGFDSAMIAAGDRVPGLVRAAIAANLALDPAVPLGPVLDLGCGTGLVAVAASDLPLGPWIGVDASQRMLALARGRGLYAELVEKDIAEYLDGTDRSFRLIIASDVFSTFGDLSNLFVAIARKLTPDGLFLFSVDEASDAAPPGPAPTGFYFHSRVALERAAQDASLIVRCIGSELLREEHGAFVPGLLAAFGRPAPSDV